MPGIQHPQRPGVKARPAQTPGSQATISSSGRRHAGIRAAARIDSPEQSRCTGARTDDPNWRIVSGIDRRVFANEPAYDIEQFFRADGFRESEIDVMFGAQTAGVSAQHKDWDVSGVRIAPQ